MLLYNDLIVALGFKKADIVRFNVRSEQEWSDIQNLLKHWEINFSFAYEKDRYTTDTYQYKIPEDIEDVIIAPTSWHIIQQNWDLKTKFRGDCEISGIALVKKRVNGWKNKHMKILRHTKAATAQELRQGLHKIRGSILADDLGIS